MVKTYPFVSVICVWLLWCSTINAMVPALEFDPFLDNPTVASEGHVTLSWITQDDRVPFENGFYQLEQSQDPDFSEAKLRYHGQDMSTFISGLSNGTYYFRVRAIGPSENPGRWSHGLQVNVEYVSSRWVLSLMILGSIIFLMTVLAVGKGHARFR